MKKEIRKEVLDFIHHITPCRQPEQGEPQQQQPEQGESHSQHLI